MGRVERQSVCSPVQVGSRRLLRTMCGMLARTGMGVIPAAAPHRPRPCRALQRTRAMSGTKRRCGKKHFVGSFVLKTILFTKTGSGYTWEKLRRKAFPAGLRSASAAPCGVCWSLFRLFAAGRRRWSSGFGAGVPCAAARHRRLAAGRGSPQRYVH